MNKIGILFIMLLCALNVNAQFSNLDMRHAKGLSFGIEKNNCLNINYGVSKIFHIGLIHSAIPEYEDKQAIGLMASFNFEPRFVQMEITPRYSTNWNIDYSTVGCSFMLRNLWKSELFLLGAEFYPFYDSDLKYQNGWAFAAQVNVLEGLAVFAEYGKKPDWRLSYKRAYMGVEAKVGNLCVKPMLEIPVYDSGARFKHSKVVVSASYVFLFKKNNLIRK